MRLLDEAMGEIVAELSSLRCKPISETGITGAVFINQEYDRCMREACEIRRHGLASNRAEAVEMAYDYLVQKATKGAWERTGEVFIDRENNRMSALCAKEPLGKEIYA